MITSKLKQVDVDTVIALALFLFFLSLYVYTAAPGVYGGDSGELAAIINEVGLAHPTGFPLYILLGKLFTSLVPIKDVAYGLNVFSSFLTALAIGVMFAVFRSLNIKRVAAILASSVLGFGSTIWSHAGAARVYPLSFLLAAVLFLVFLKWFKSRQPLYIYVYTFLLTLSFGSHFLSVLMILPFIFILWSTYKNLPIAFSLKKTIILFLLPLTQYLFLFWANGKNSIFNWGMTGSFKGFIDYITQRDFSYKIATFDGNYLLEGIGKISILFVSEFTIFFFLFFIAGIFILFRKKFRFGAMLFLIIFVNIAIVLLYGNGNDLKTGIIFRYFFISYLAMSVFIALSIDFFIAKIRSINQHAPKIFLFGLVLLILFYPLKLGWRNNNRHSNYVISDFAENILKTLTPNSILLAEGDASVFPLWYLQTKGQRRDVLIIAQEFLAHDWYVRQLNAKYPAMIPREILYKRGPNNTATVSARVKEIIQNNFGGYSIYINFFNTADISSAGFISVPTGVLGKLEDKNWNRLDALKEINSKLWEGYRLRGLEKKYIESDINKVALFYPASLNNLAGFYVKFNDKKDAVLALEKSIEINPNYELAKRNLEIIKKIP